MPGSKETKEVVSLFLNLVEALSESLEDGNIGLTDALNFFSTLQALSPAIEGIADVPKELAELDETEKAELNAYIAAEFDLKNDKVEHYIEQALAGVLLLADLIPLFTKKKDA